MNDIDRAKKLLKEVGAEINQTNIGVVRIYFTMIRAEVSGVKAKEVQITPNCRKVNGISDAMKKALIIIHNEYLDLNLLSANKDANYNIVLTVDRPWVIV